jgi:hypothetical protein
MAEVSNSKVWTKTRLTATGTSTRNAQNILFERLYKHLAANCGWTVVSSSNGVDTAGAGDNIGVDNPAHIVAGAEGVNHSWVLLQNDHIATGFQALFNFWSYGSGTESVKCEVSLVGFTGGSLQYKPTSAFSVLICTFWKTTSALLTFSANVFNSSDFECTRWFIGPTTVQGYAIFDRPYGSPAWFSVPNMAIVSRKLATLADNDGLYFVTQTYGNYINTRSALDANMVGASGDNGGRWPLYHMLCTSSNIERVGIFGRLHDLWWAPTQLLNGDTFPGPGNDIKTQVVIGNMVLGNDGTALVL